VPPRCALLGAWSTRRLPKPSPPKRRRPRLYQKSAPWRDWVAALGQGGLPAAAAGAKR